MLLVIGHGREQSLCHSLARGVLEELREREVPCRVHDLLRDGFDPSLRLAPGARHATACAPEEDALVHGYQRDVRWASLLVFVHPSWWFAPPAILKGWIDRVLVHEVAIEQRDDGPPRPLLGGRAALVVQTYNAPRLADRVLCRGVSGSFWRRVVCPSVGLHPLSQVALYEVEGMDAAGFAAARARVSRALARLIWRPGLHSV